MWLKWLPWRYVVSRLARRQGFVDPVAVLSQLHRFAEPSEVAVPVELLRSGVVFHARGLMNTKAIQHNLDWVWPYWVQRQFDPEDESFVPRAFSITHVNLTHRNWTAIGLPNVDLLPIVDPRGLLTPHWDGWSLDGWILAGDGTELLPSKCDVARQYLDMDGGLAAITECEVDGLQLTTRAEVKLESGRPVCRQAWTARSVQPSWLVIALRPYNPEGVSFVHHVELDRDLRGWTVDGHARVLFSTPAQRHRMSDYRRGDVYFYAPAGDDAFSVQCDVGMATAAALFELRPDRTQSVAVTTPLIPAEPSGGRPRRIARMILGRPKVRTPSQQQSDAASWQDALSGHARLDIPDAKLQFLYEAAMRTLILHTPGDVYPGPYTYKRFWVRDTAFIVHALLCSGLVERAERVLPKLLARQIGSGYFRSQDGEWDANGEALWTLWRFCRLSGRQPPAQWRSPLLKGAQWIVRKRLSADSDAPHAGLLPPGFSAEHLGQNDYYYWDDYWAAAGLRAAAALLEELDERASAEAFRHEADDLLASVEGSLSATASHRPRCGIPASPYRRMDSGAVGSLVAGYPLQLLEPDDPRLLDTVAVLREHFFVNGGFFQDMIHSGINPYLTLHVAQVLLRAGDPSWMELLHAVATLASPTGQWPEAIHPRTLGGCMGDGQHAWAAAEWAMAMRNAFVREEAGRLIIASGLSAGWTKEGKSASFGPAPTPWGTITIAVESCGKRLVVRWQGAWRGEPPPMEVRPFDFEAKTVTQASGEVTLQQRPMR